MNRRHEDFQSSALPAELSRPARSGHDPVCTLRHVNKRLHSKASNFGKQLFKFDRKAPGPGSTATANRPQDPCVNPKLAPHLASAAIKQRVGKWEPKFV